VNNPGSSTFATLPDVRIPNVDPFVGNSVRAESAVPFGESRGGAVTKLAPVTSPGVAAMAFAIARAPAALFGTGVTAALAAPDVKRARAQIASKAIGPRRM